MTATQFFDRLRECKTTEDLIIFAVDISIIMKTEPHGFVNGLVSILQPIVSHYDVPTSNVKSQSEADEQERFETARLILAGIVGSRTAYQTESCVNNAYALADALIKKRNDETLVTDHGN